MDLNILRWTESQLVVPSLFEDRGCNSEARWSSERLWHDPSKYGHHARSTTTNPQFFERRDIGFLKNNQPSLIISIYRSLHRISALSNSKSAKNEKMKILKLLVMK
jgi:hypothetical protein